MKNSKSSASMSAAKRLTGRLMLAVACIGSTGCAMDVFWLPEKAATVQEAFPNFTPPGDPVVARQAAMQQTFDAPYEDVYQAVNISTSQALFQVHEQNKRAGVVLATEALRNQPTDRVYTTFYYAILIKERGPRQTSVTVIAKVQYPCSYRVVGAGYHIGSLGITKALQSMENNKEICTRLSTLRWAAVVSSDSDFTYPFSPDRTPEIGRFLSFVRNNLIAAGFN